MDLLPNQARVFGNAIKLQLYRKLCFTFAKKNQKIKNQAKSGYSYITVLQYTVRAETDVVTWGAR